MARKTPSTPTSLKNRSVVQTDEHARHFAWVDWLSARTARSDAALARDAGLNPNYLYRKRGDGTVLGATQIRMLSEHYGLPGPDTYLFPGSAGLSDEGARFDASSEGTDPVLRQMIEVALKGHSNAVPWLLRTRALEDAGYLSGDIVIADASVTSKAGDAVSAQVFDVRSGTVETVFRILEPPYLIAACSDPGLRRPLLVDNERVIVMATITLSFRARRQ